MDFLQHFLIGKPFEHNAQTSYMLSGTLAMNFFANALEARLTVDAETADSELTEFQPGPATDGAPAANAIRPAGFHYDYTRRLGHHGRDAGARLALRRALVAGRARCAPTRTRYDYDNRMINGNTATERRALRRGGCLYSRPADRSDNFDNVAPRVTLSWQPGDRSLLYLSGSTGFRPPEMTELYRLQRQQIGRRSRQRELDSLEAGWKVRGTGASRSRPRVFAMRKRNLILRESNGFNVSNGRTTHRGFEYEARVGSLTSFSRPRRRHLRAARICILARGRRRRDDHRRQRRRHRAAPRAQPRHRRAVQRALLGAGST